MTSYFWLLFSYLFASIPNGYLIVKWLSGKDIRKIGKKKLSGSNIIQNVGFLPGLLSAVIDASKGFIAVYFAHSFGFSPKIQALSVAFAICGQMWPIFLKFWGGRGGAVTIGALLAFSSFSNFFIFLIPLSFWIFCKIISKEKGAAIGMMLYYVFAGIMGVFFEKEAVMFFSLFAFLLILIQRVLGEPKSFKKIKNNKEIIIRRIFLDRDTEEV